MPDKRLLPFLVPAVLLFANYMHASAQTAHVPTQIRTGFDQIRESDSRADLRFVTPDALHGCMSLQPGHEAAVANPAGQ
jgi:hypothetical protein